MRKMWIRLCLAFLFIVGGMQAMAAEKNISTLFLEFRQQSGYLEETAILGASRRSIRLNDGKGALNKRMVRLNTMLEKYSKQADDELEQELGELGDLLYEPISDSIDRCDTVAIRISFGMLRFPFEHLFYKGKPLGLQKPVFVHFDNLSTEPFSIKEIESSLILADLTADPEEACKDAAKKLPNAEYLDFADLEFRDLKRLRKHDLLLVSAHGDISFSDEDCIDFGEESVYPDSWAKVAPQLAYFDSCQLGVSREFISAFKDAGTRYLLAPVTSNEAGNSSTKTIEAFFAKLLAGESPERALFLAKTALYERFSHGKKISLGKLLYRALPFRVYRLN